MIAAQGDQAAITAYLAGKGMPAAGIAGVEGNLQVESGMRAGAYNPRENAHGYAQWEGGRWTGLQRFAQGRGTSPTDSQTELDFLWSELNSPAYSGVLTGLMTATDPGQAATLFDQQYERSSPASLPARVSAAQAIAAGGVAGGSGSTTSSGAGTQQAWNPLGGLVGGLWGGMFDALKPVGRVLVSAGLVMAGLVMVIVAAVILAKAGDSSGGGSSSPAPAAGGDDTPDDEGQATAPAPEQHHRAAGAAADAEDAAVAA